MFDPPKGSWEILPFARATNQDQAVPALDRAGAEAFLRQFKFDYGIMVHLRELLAPTDPVSRFTDDEVIEAIATRLSTRELLFRRGVARQTSPAGGGKGNQQSQPSTGGPDAPSGPATTADEPEPDTFGSGSDGQAQAAALGAAAAAGSPFSQPCNQPTPSPQPGPKPKPTAPPKPKKKFIEIHWVDKDGWCSDPVHVAGTTQNYSDGENVAITVTPTKHASSKLASFNQGIQGNSFTHEWKILNVLPPKSGPHYVNELDVDAHGGGKTTPTHLHIHFIPTVPKTHYAQDRVHFDLSATDYVMKIESQIKYVKGWGASVVKLGPAAPAGTGGLLDGQLSWAGYRWMKTVAGTPKFWDGTAWQNLPAGFTLIDANNFCVGFYKTGTTFTCQYGGVWPETFTDWDINAAPKQKVLKKWKDNIHSVWTAKFDIKRIECKSTVPACCRYSTTASADFSYQTTFAAGMLIVADGNIRSNDSLWFIGEPRVAVAGHEFGHHLGNPDEYAGAAVDTSLNSDGAVNGIDADSIMGQNLTKVKKRHYTTICKHFAAMVKTAAGKTYTYKAVPVSGG